MAKRRWLWRFWQAHLHPQQLVFLDETGANTKLTRLYGRAPRGQRVVGKVPHGHWKTTTFVGALRAEGFVAPTVLDGPINGAAFREYVEQQLVPVLRAGDVVIMDNLATHKAAGGREAIEGAWAGLVYLPPLQSGPEPDRAGLRQAQVPVTRGGRANRRGA